MLGRFGLRGPVAHNLAVDEQDTVDTKKALARLGHYSVPKWGVTPYPDTAMFEGVKSFQRSQGLAVDGRMAKDGPTARLLDGALRAGREDRRRRRPTLSLAGDVGGDARPRPQDVQAAKRALAWAGVYPAARAQSPTGEADPALDSAIRMFQGRYNLKPDGLMRPDGPTARMLERAIRPAVEDHLKSRGQARATSFMPMYDWAWKDGRLQRIQVDVLGQPRPFEEGWVKRGGRWHWEPRQSLVLSLAEEGPDDADGADIHGDASRFGERVAEGLKTLDDFGGTGGGRRDEDDAGNRKNGQKGAARRGERPKRSPGAVRPLDDILGDGPDEADEMDIFGENPPVEGREGTSGRKPGARDIRRRPTGETRSLDDLFGDGPDETDEMDLFGEDPPAEARDGLTAAQRAVRDERLGGRRLHGTFGEGRISEQFAKATEANPREMASIQNRMLVADKLTPRQLRELRKDIDGLDLSVLGGGESGFRWRLNNEVTLIRELTNMTNRKTRSIPELKGLKDRIEKTGSVVENISSLFEKLELFGKMFNEMSKNAAKKVEDDINKR